MFGRFRKNYQKEDGAYMVITALLLTAIIGFMVLAVDQGSWLSQKRTEQNAVDAAAVAAAETYANGGSGDQAAAAALNAANQNGIVATASDLMITPDNAADPKKVKAVLTLDADNYFYNNGESKNKTAIVVTSEAQIYEEQTQGGSYIINPAIEASKFLWSGTGTTDNEITGDIVIGNQGMTMTNPTTINGNISSDGMVYFNDGKTYVINGNINSKQDIIYNQPLTINGNLESLGNIQYMAGNAGNPNNIINGDVHANGNINIYNSTVRGNILAKGDLNILYDIINGDTIANGKSSVQNATINGSVLSKGELDFSDGTIVKNNVISETWTKINGGQDHSKVDGTFYLNESGERTQNYQKEQMKKTDGSAVHFEDYSGQTVPTVSTVTHTDWVWKWDCLYKALDVAYHVTDTDLNDFACSKEVVSKYGTGAWIGGGFPNTGSRGWVNLNSLQFKNTTVLQMFLDFIAKKTGSATTPVYFPGYVTVNDDHTRAKVQGFIIAENNISYDPPCDVQGCNTSFMSINGNITLGNGAPSNITGAVVCLNPNANIQLNGGQTQTGTITGGVISHGTVTMNGAWSIIADQNWQKYVPVSGGTKTVKKVKLIS